MSLDSPHRFLFHYRNAEVSSAYSTLALAIATNRQPENCGHLYQSVYRQCAVAHTNFWAAYGIIISNKRHRAVVKAKQSLMGETSMSDCFNKKVKRAILNDSTVR